MKYLKRINETIESDDINWGIIEDIKDMSLEYLDDSYILGIHVYSLSTKDLVYTLFYSLNWMIIQILRNYI